MNSHTTTYQHLHESNFHACVTLGSHALHEQNDEGRKLLAEIDNLLRHT